MSAENFKKLRCCQKVSGTAQIFAKLHKDDAYNNLYTIIIYKNFPSKCKIAKINFVFNIKCKIINEDLE